MEKAELRKFFHDMRNSLNTLNINVVHLQLHSTQEKAIVERLETALQEAATALAEFEQKMQNTNLTASI